MRKYDQPLRHSHFSDAVGSGVRIIFNIDAYSADRFALETCRLLVVLLAVASTQMLRRYNDGNSDPKSRSSYSRHRLI